MSNPTWCGKISYCYAQDLNGFCEDNCKTSCNKYKEPVKESKNPSWCNHEIKCPIEIRDPKNEEWCRRNCTSYKKTKTKFIVVANDVLTEISEINDRQIAICFKDVNVIKQLEKFDIKTIKFYGVKL